MCRGTIEHKPVPALPQRGRRGARRGRGGARVVLRRHHAHALRRAAQPARPRRRLPHPRLRDQRGRLLRVAEGAGPQQALPRARGGQPVLHRPAQVPGAGAAGGALPARAHLHQQAGREALPRAPAAAQRPALLSPAPTPAAGITGSDDSCRRTRNIVRKN